MSASQETSPGPNAALARAGRRQADRVAGKLAEEYLAAIRAGDGGRAEEVARRGLAAGLGLGEVHALVIEPAMKRIGELWEAGETSVADEHLATAITEGVVAAIFPEALRTATGGGETVLLAGVEGERHVLGLRMVGDVLEGRGHTVHMLGADIPLDALLAALDRWRPDLVGLSVATPFSAPVLREFLTALGERNARVIVGGQGVPEFARECGVPCVDNVLEIPEDLSAVTAPRKWRACVSRSAAAGTEAAPEQSGGHASVAATIARTAGEVADLARAAMRERYLYERLASIDPVTALPNRRAWDEELERAAASGDDCVAMVDVDSFKHVNDSRGHAGGDTALRAIADLLAHTLREGDFVARFGGDEFGVLIRGAALAEGVEVAERLRRSVEEGLSGVTTISVGVAELDRDSRAGTIAADRALYEAKSAGRNRVASLDR